MPHSEAWEVSALFPRGPAEADKWQLERPGLMPYLTGPNSVKEGLDLRLGSSFTRRPVASGPLTSHMWGSGQAKMFPVKNHCSSIKVRATENKNWHFKNTRY